MLVIVAVVLLAAWIVTHVALFFRVVTVTEITNGERGIALVPVATPWLAWKYGKKRHTVLHVALLVAYLVVLGALLAR